jgi:hypothetical protein
MTEEMGWALVYALCVVVGMIGGAIAFRIGGGGK